MNDQKQSSTDEYQENNDGMCKHDIDNKFALNANEEHDVNKEGITIIDDENVERLKHYINELNSRIQLQNSDRKKLEERTPLSEDQLRKMDSTLKKTTAFMKKLRNIGSSQSSAVLAETILADIKKINLSKFMEEVTSTIADAVIKLSDIQTVVTICVQLSLRYAEFQSLLLLEYRKNLPLKRTDKILNPSKLRVDIRLIGELCMHGVFNKDGIQLLGSALSFITITDKAEHINVPILLPFCKALVADLLGSHPFSIMEISNKLKMELPSSPVISEHHKQIFSKILLNYRTSLFDRVTKELFDMNHLLRSIKRQTRTRGDATVEDRNRLESIRSLYEKHFQILRQLSDFIGVPMESMNEEQSDDEEEEISRQEMGRALQDGTLSIWPDEDTRQFYESLMELRQLVPPMLFEESEKRTIDLVEGEIDDVDVSGLEDILEENEPGFEEMDESEVIYEEETNTDSSELNSIYATSHIEVTTISGQDTNVSMKSFLEQLPWLINRDLIDNAAFDFVNHLNTKSNRKKLCQMLLEQHSNRVDLLPFYARLIATLEPVMPDLALEISHSLIRQFRTTVQNKSKLGVDRKMRCCRFISELVKFKIIPKAEALACLRMLLFDFRHHNVDMCCSMVESMGQFLYRSTDSHSKTKILLEVMMKKRHRVNDSRHQMLIDNAYFTCIPPSDEEKTECVRVPLHDFIHHLIVQLTNFRLDSTIRSFRRLDWSNPETANYAVHCLSSPCLPKYIYLNCLASLVSALMEYHDWIGIRVLDNTLEYIRISLEFNNPSLNQSSVLSIIFLGQLYNYSVCDSPIIFKTLYQLISFGAFDPVLDDWNNLTRIILVCELLFTCGEYYSAGSAKKKLDCFLSYFYRYFVIKYDAFSTRNVSFPSDIKFRVEEMTEYVRKDFDIPETIDDAQKAIEKIEFQYKNMIDIAVLGENDQEIEEEEEIRITQPRYALEAIIEDECSSSEEVETLFYDETEQLHVHKNRVVLPEDDQVIRQLDQMIADAMQVRVLPLAVPPVEITVPTSARQKFHKRIDFEQNASVDTVRDTKKSSTMAILIRGKGNKSTLKAISMDLPGCLTDSWTAERAKELKELTAHKNITLSMNERIMADEEISE